MPTVCGSSASKTVKNESSVSGGYGRRTPRVKKVPGQPVYAQGAFLGGPRWCERDYVDLVDVAWRWLVGGLAAVIIGLAVWWSAFIFVPAGVVLLIIGTAKSVRPVRRRSVRSRR